MALVESTSKRLRLRYWGAAALALASLSGAGAYYATQGTSQSDLVEDVRWTLPPPPASLTASIAAPLTTSDMSASKTLPTPPPAPQDARELNVSAPHSLAMVDMPAPSSAIPVTQIDPESVVAEATAMLAVATPKATAKTSPNSDAARDAKQTQRKQTKPTATVTRAPKPKASTQTALRAPVRAKVTELPPAPSITPEPAVIPPAPQDKRIPIISNIADGMSAVGNSLSSLVR
jgi:hypothetical protein